MDESLDLDASPDVPRWLLCDDYARGNLAQLYEKISSISWNDRNTYRLTDNKIPNRLPKSAGIDSKGILSVFLFWCLQVSS